MVQCTRKLLAIASLLTCCTSTCFREENSTTPMKALSVFSNIKSVLLCKHKCLMEPLCVSASYSDTKRICHVQVPTEVEFPTCGVTPYRRFVKTNENCVGSTAQNFSVDYVRQNLAREHGLDLCYPDRSLLHPELINLKDSGPICPIRKLDGSQGPVYVFRGMGQNGYYGTFDNSGANMLRYDSGENLWKYWLDSKKNGFHRVVSAACAEIGDDCSCGPLTMTPNITNATPAPPNQPGACPGKKLYARRPWVTSDQGAPHKFDGNSAMLFCSGNEWFEGENDPGNVYMVWNAACAD